MALSRVFAGNVDVWLFETARGILRRFTTDPAAEVCPTGAFALRGAGGGYGVADDVKRHELRLLEISPG